MNKILQTIIAILFIIFISWFRADAPIQAGDEHNTSGYAWSENIGWMSFNSTTGGGANYGVNIDSISGDLSGYAWSENIGWVSFNRSDTGNPPEAPFNGDSGAIAKYNSDNNEVTGWMKVLASGDGWDGWVKFYNITLDINGDWHGWAWSSEVIGWVSFNGTEGGGSYKVTSSDVVNQSPIASDLDVSVGNTATYCGATAAHYFSWAYSDADGHNESRFQFQIDNDSDFSSLTIDRDYSGLSNPSPTTNNQTVAVVSSPNSDQLTYDTTYYWRVMVFDEKGANSGWVEGLSFTTEEHQYPSIDFNWSPQEPSEEEDALFTDQSTVYGGAGKSSWSWSFEDGNPNSSAEQSPTIQFVSSGGKEVVLEVTDSDDFTCSESRVVDVQWTLPDWKEVAP